MYHPQLAVLEANAVREQEGIFYQDIPNPRDTRIFVICCILKEKKERSKNFLSWLWTYRCSFLFKAGMLEDDLSFGKKQEQRAYSVTFQKELIYPEICLASILTSPYPGTQLNTPCHLAQNFIFPLWPSTHLRDSPANLSVPICSSEVQEAAPHFPTAIVIQCKGDEPLVAPHLSKTLSCATTLGLFQELTPVTASQPRPLKARVHFLAIPEPLKWVDIQELLLDIATWASSCCN